jgi:hypothetical protein
MANFHRKNQYRIIVLMLIFIALTSISYGKPVIERVYSHSGWGEAYTLYRIYDDSNHEITSEQLNSIMKGYLELEGNLTESWLERQVNITYEVSEPQYEWVNITIDCWDNQTNTSGQCTTLIKNQTGIIKENKTKLVWARIDNFDGLSLPAGQTFEIRHYGRYVMSSGQALIDNWLCINDSDGNPLCYTQYDWWNASWNTYRNITFYAGDYDRIHNIVYMELNASFTPHIDSLRILYNGQLINYSYYFPHNSTYLPISFWIPNVNASQSVTLQFYYNNPTAHLINYSAPQYFHHSLDDSGGFYLDGATISGGKCYASSDYARCNIPYITSSSLTGHLPKPMDYPSIEKSQRFVFSKTSLTSGYIRSSPTNDTGSSLSADESNIFCLVDSSKFLDYSDNVVIAQGNYPFSISSDHPYKLTLNYKSDKHAEAWLNNTHIPNDITNSTGSSILFGVRGYYGYLRVVGDSIWDIEIGEGRLYPTNPTYSISPPYQLNVFEIAQVYFPYPLYPLSNKTCRFNITSNSLVNYSIVANLTYGGSLIASKTISNVNGNYSGIISTNTPLNPNEVIDCNVWINSTANTTDYASTSTIIHNHLPSMSLNNPPNGSSSESYRYATLNLTYYDSDLQGGYIEFYNASGLIANITGLTNGSFAAYSLPHIPENTTYLWYAVASDYFNSTRSPNYTFSVPPAFYAHKLIYDDPAPTETWQTIRLYLNHTLTSSIISGTANLTYNHTLYSATISDYSEYTLIEASVPTPNTTSEIEFTFNYSFNMSFAGGIYDTTSGAITANQSIYSWGLTNCTATGNKTLTFFIGNEEDPGDYLTSTFQVEADYWYNNRSLSHQFHASYSGSNNYSLCIYPTTLELHTNIYIKYSTTDGFTHRWYLNNLTVSNNTQTYTIYNFNHTSGISELRITIQDESTYSPLSNIYVSLLRGYTGEGVYRVVQMDKSGDLGQVVFHIHEATTDYKLAFYNAYNYLLRQTATMKFICSSGVCDATFIINPDITPTTSRFYNLTSYYDNSTQLLTVNWSFLQNRDLDITVYHATATGNQEICTYTTISSSGSYSCNLSGVVGGQAYVLAEVDNLPAYSKYYQLKTASISDYLSKAVGAFIAFIIVAVFIGISSFSPVGVVMGVIIAFVFLFTLGLFSAISISTLLVLGVVGIIISFKLKS